MNTFDRQNYKEQLERMLQMITDTRKKLEPRKRFRFSRRQEDFGVKVVREEKEEKSKEGGFEDRVPGLAGVEGGKVIVKSDELNKPYKVIKCKDAEIELHGMT